MFWQMVTDLDVPVYMHPRGNTEEVIQLEFQHAIWLEGSAQSFATTLSSHVLGLCANGIFECVSGFRHEYSAAKMISD